MFNRLLTALVGLSLAALGGCAVGPGRASYQPPRLLFEASPVYPAAALAARQEGSVRLSVMVDTAGRSTEVEVVGEKPHGQGFGEAAREAVVHWIWTAPRMNGAAVSERRSLTLHFDPQRAVPQPPPPVLVLQREPVRPEKLAPDRDGAAVVEVEVLSDGTARRVSVISEDPERCGLGAAVFDCVKRWRWTVGTPGTAFVVVSFRAEADRRKAVQQGV
ncbi:MAG: energy transducer TonB [Acidobacteriota bacterium]